MMVETAADGVETGDRRIGRTMRAGNTGTARGKTPGRGARTTAREDNATGNAGDPGDGEVVAEFAKNSREVVRVRLTKFRGIDLVDVRIWWEDKEGAWWPGKGLAIRRCKAGKLRDALALIPDEPDPDDDEDDGGSSGPSDAG